VVANRINQDHVALLTHAIPAIIKGLYQDLENESIAQYGCSVISSLVRNHEKNQRSFSAVCNYIADVVFAHKYPGPTSSRVLTKAQEKSVYAINVEACRAMSLLAKGHMLNRNRLGNADACSAALLALSFGDK
jgi:hypothetical protein